MDRQLKFSMGPTQVRLPVLEEESYIRRIPSKKEAIRQCIYRSGMTAKFVAEKLGIDQGHMSRVMTDQAHFPDDKEYDLMNLCGNFIPLQWMAARFGFDLVKETSRAKQIRELKEQLRVLEGATVEETSDAR